MTTHPHRMCAVPRCPSKHAYRVVRGERKYSLYCDNHTCRAADPSTMAFCTTFTETGRTYCSNHSQCAYLGCSVAPEVHPSSLRPFICGRHTCATVGCKKPKQTGKETCSEHTTCHLYNCDQVTRRGQAYCLFHQCHIDGCLHSRDISADKQSQFCGIHTCHVNTCPNAVGDTFNISSLFCDTHKCRTQTCLQRADVLGGHCANHGCRSTGCVNTKTPKGNYCVDHKCKQSNCHTAAETSGGYCRVHSCVKPKCLNQNRMDDAYPGLCYTHVMEAVREEATVSAQSQIDQLLSTFDSRSSLHESEKLRAEKQEAKIRKEEQQRAKKQHEENVAAERRRAAEQEAERLREEADRREVEKRARELERRRLEKQERIELEARIQERLRADARAEAAQREKTRRQQSRRASYVDDTYAGKSQRESSQRTRSRFGDSGATTSEMRQRQRERQKARDRERDVFIWEARNKLVLAHRAKLSDFEKNRIYFGSETEFLNTKASLARRLEAEEDKLENDLVRAFTRGEMDDYLDKVVGPVIDIRDEYHANASSDESTSSHRYGGSDIIW